MADSLRYPTWQDVGLPLSIVRSIQQLGAGSTLDYLVLNRVMRFNVRAQYTYECKHCGFTKTLHRMWEDYSTCERCGRNKICSVAYWRMGKDKMEPYSQRDSYASRVIQQMASAYAQYFRVMPPDDFVQTKWEWRKDQLDIPKDRPAFGRISDEDITSGLYEDQPLFAAQFCCGEKVVASHQTLSICKAAVLCPFLWDDCFDWKYLTPKDRAHETHILPLLNMWLRLKNGDRNSPRMEPPHWAAADDFPAENPIGGMIELEEPEEVNQMVVVPDAIAQVLQNDADVLQQIFGNHPHD